MWFCVTQLENTDRTGEIAIRASVRVLWASVAPLAKVGRGAIDGRACHQLDGKPARCMMERRGTLPFDGRRHPDAGSRSFDLPAGRHGTQRSAYASRGAPSRGSPRLAALASRTFRAASA